MSYQRRKSRVGRVIGDKMDKSCIVEVEWRSFHRRYKKSIRRRSRFKAHDENNTARIGDTVTIIESRPMSKTKRWRLVDIVERQEIAEMPSLEISLSDEVEASMPDLVVEETVSQEEEVPVQAEAQDEPLDEAVTSAEDAPADSEDDKIIECAVVGEATHIVTGDRRHLLPLGSYQGVLIITAANFLAQFL